MPNRHALLVVPLLVVSVLTVVFPGLPAGAAPAAGPPEGALKTQRGKLQGERQSAPDRDREAEAMLSAVVRVRMKAIGDARSNATLGRTREGSGVVIDDRGHIVTIGYIVIEADSIEIVTHDHKTVPARLVGYDHATGFGLLRAGLPLQVTPMPLGDAGALALREAVMVLPHGGRDSASIAYVVAKRKFTANWEYSLETAIFTSPPTMQWAGAALVSREGKLVGIGSLLVRDTVEPGTPLAGNMFVPIDLLKPILPALIERGRRAAPPQPWLGMATDEVSGRLFVSRVSPDGPADKAGVKRGDIIVGVGADPVQTLDALYAKIWALGAAGVEVPLKVLQGAEVRDITLKSIDRFEYFREKPML